MENLAEREARRSFTRRALIPFAYTGILIALCVWFAGSYFIEIEDHYANVILGGGYGSFDPYTSQIHPLLGRLIVGLYSITSAVNWFGITLLALLFCAGAAAVSLTAHRSDGLAPGFIILSPILVVLVCSLQSRVVAAMCVISGVLCVLDGCADGGRGTRRAIMGALLCAAGTALSMELAWILAACALALALASHRKAFHGRAFWISLPIVILAIGASTLTAELDSTWRTFHHQYNAYERATGSYLVDEVRGLLSDYGVVLSLDGGAPSGVAKDLWSQLPPEEEAVAASSLGKIGFSLNDADFFTRRSSADAELVSPENVAKVNKYAAHFSARGIADGIVETLKKNQFLMLLGLFLFSALAIELTNRGRGLHTLIAAIVAFGGHAVMIMFNRTSFRDIAPFYLLSILSLLIDYDAAASLATFKNMVKSRIVRGIIACVAAVGFIGMMGLLLAMVRSYNRAESPSLAASEELYDMMEKLPDAVFIGDNPLDKYNPSALAVPRFGADARLMAGSYDLYSPRRKDIAERFNLTNPLRDAVDRLDVVYVDMSGATLAIATERLYEAYDIVTITQQPTSQGEPLLSPYAPHRMQVYWLQSITKEEYDSLVSELEAEQQAQLKESIEQEKAEAENRFMRILGKEPSDILLESFREEYGYTYRTEPGYDPIEDIYYVDYIAIEETPVPATPTPMATPTPTPTPAPDEASAP